jgi:hypothetical protein
MIVKLDEASILKAFGPGFLEVMRHTVRQLGNKAQQTTLPEVAAQTDGLTPVVNNLTIVLSATNATIASIINDTSEHRFSEARALTLRLDEMQAALERAEGERIALARALSDMQDQFGIDDAPVPAWGAPGAIGSIAPNTGAFTTASTTGDVVINGITIGRAAAANVFRSTNNFAIRPPSANPVAGVYFQDTTGLTTWGYFNATGLTVNLGFGCNGKLPQTPVALGAAATDLPTVIALANNLRTMAINNGTGS